jgi:hypothetical protein
MMGLPEVLHLDMVEMVEDTVVHHQEGEEITIVDTEVEVVEDIDEMIDHALVMIDGNETEDMVVVGHMVVGTDETMTDEVGDKQRKPFESGRGIGRYVNI